MRAYAGISRLRLFKKDLLKSQSKNGARYLSILDDNLTNYRLWNTRLFVSLTIFRTKHLYFIAYPKYCGYGHGFARDM